MSQHKASSDAICYITWVSFFGWFCINMTLRSEIWSLSLASPLPASLYVSYFKSMCLSPRGLCLDLTVPMCGPYVWASAWIVTSIVLPVGFYVEWIKNVSYLNGTPPNPSNLPSSQMYPPFLEMEQRPHSDSPLHGTILGLILYKSCACCHKHCEFKCATTLLCS